MKRGIVFACLFSLCAGLGVAQTPVYRDPGGVFSVSLPPGWAFRFRTKDPPASEDEVSSLDFQFTPDGNDHAVLSIFVTTDTAAAPTAEVQAASAEETFKKSHCRIVSHRNVKVGNLTGVRLTYTMSGSTATGCVVTYLASGRSEVQLEGTTLATDFDTLRPAFEHIEDSFRLLAKHS